jgi:hypothetical protein
MSPSSRILPILRPDTSSPSNSYSVLSCPVLSCPVSASSPGRWALGGRE